MISGPGGGGADSINEDAYDDAKNSKMKEEEKQFFLISISPVGTQIEIKVRLRSHVQKN